MKPLLLGLLIVISVGLFLIGGQAQNAANPVASATGKILTTTANVTITGTDGAALAVGVGGTPAYVGAGNTWTTGAQDMGSATSLKIPTSAGADPAASGQIAHDSTLGTDKGYDDLGAAPVTYPGILSMQYALSDTLTCSTISTTETAFATVYTVPANFLVAGKALRITMGLAATYSSSPPSYTTRVRWGGIGGTLLWSAVGNSSTATSVTTGNYATGIIQGTAAAGASAASYTFFGSGNAQSNTVGLFGNTRNTTTQPINIATNASAVLTFTLQCAANTAGNSATIQELIVEALAAP